MGNCSYNSMDSKRSASQNLSLLFSKVEPKSPISFVIKEWPARTKVDLKSSADAASRNLDLFLYPGEKIEITLKNHQKEAAGNNDLPIDGRYSVVSSKYSLHCEIRKNNQFYQVNFPVERQCQYLWKYIQGWTDFSQGDVLKMGVTKYKLSKFVSQENNELDNLRKTLHCNKMSSISQSAPRCRICLSSIDTPENPFISPCRCEGSIKLTHLRCLSEWLFSSSLNQNQFLTIRVNKTVCQLCKTDITNTPEFKQMENLLLTNIHDIPPPFGIFQRSFQQRNDELKSYLVLCFNVKKQYSFGRINFGKGDVADISQNDLHISKINTEMKYNNGRLTIRDCQSLHGTLLQVRQPIRLYKSNSSQNLAFHNMLIKIIYEPKLQQNDLTVLPEINQNPSTKIL